MEVVPDQQERLKVVYMASCARSGETMLLNALAQYSGIFVPFDLAKINSTEEEDLKNFIIDNTPSEILRSSSTVFDYIPPNADLVIAKQGVWRPNKKFDGFILARNPASVISSLLLFDKKHARSIGIKRKRILFKRFASARERELEEPHWERLLRWQNNINPELTPIISELDYIDALCVFYNSRMIDLASLGLPIFRYEDIVKNPDQRINEIIVALGYENRTDVSDIRPISGEGIGHGGTDLGRAIDKSSLHSYKSHLSMNEFDRICALTYEAWKALGYRLNGMEFSTFLI